MTEPAFLGRLVRRLRSERGLTQVELARRLAISPSYLNLIEHDQRTLTVPLLLKLADVLEVDLRSFSGRDEARLLADLREVLGDAVFDGTRPDEAELREVVTQTPGVARALEAVYRAYRGVKADASAMAERLSGEADLDGDDSSLLPSEEVSDLLQEHRNHFPELEREAQAFWDEAGLDGDDLFRGLVAWLDREHDVTVTLTEGDRAPGTVRRFDERRRELQLSKALPSTSLVFQLAHQIGLLRARGVLDGIVAGGRLSTADSRALARVALANYFAGAVTMPYGAFRAAAEAVRYDVELLEHRFRTSFEQVCHRLTTLAEPGNQGIPFHLIRIDIAGNISKRFSASGIRFARYSGACPRWIVHSAFATPGAIRTQVSRMPDGPTFFCFARTVRKAGGGYHVAQSRYAVGLGCDVRHARELVYSDGVDLDNDDAAVPVGVTCRLCERMDCRQRAFPPIQHRLDVDENVRGLSFYYAPPAGDGA